MSYNVYMENDKTPGKNTAKENRLYMAMDYFEGIAHESKSAISYLEILANPDANKEDVSHAIEMTSDVIAHDINMLKLIVNAIDGSFISGDAQPALTELAPFVKDPEK